MTNNGLALNPVRVVQGVGTRHGALWSKMRVKCVKIHVVILIDIVFALHAMARPHIKIVRNFYRTAI